MSFVLWLCISLPLLLICYILFSWLSTKIKKQYSVIIKGAGSFLCVASAWLAVSAAGDCPWFHPAVWALFFCMLGDIFIEWNFIAGGLSFSVAHSILIFWMFYQGWMHFGSIFVWLVTLVVLCAVLRKEAQTMGKMAPLLFLYGMLLTGDFALAAVLPFLQGIAYLPMAAGLFCFVASDTVLGKDMFGVSSKRNQWILMALYYGALYFISITLWML